jgi:hypothetical protein
LLDVLFSDVELLESDEVSWPTVELELLLELLDVELELLELLLELLELELELLELEELASSTSNCIQVAALAASLVQTHMCPRLLVHSAPCRKGRPSVAVSSRSFVVPGTFVVAV